MDKLPPLTSLAALEAFFRTGSVGGAADLLGRTHSAISKQLHQLQDHSGTELFIRRGLQLELTSDGRLLAETVARSMDEMRRTYTTITGGGRTSVTIAASSTFARQWLIPTIARFNIEYPDIDVLIRVMGARDLRRAEGPVDLVTSWDRLKYLNVEYDQAVSLGDVHMGVVLAPSYPFEMSGKTLTVQTILHRRDAENSWENWSRLSGITVIRERELTFDLSSLAFEAVERGMGATIAPKFLIEKELKSSSLIAPAGFLTFKDGLLIYPAAERPKLSKPARLLRDWMVANAQLDADGFIANAAHQPWPFTSAGVDW
ncbi:LysR substrate-binding domain-containing protein [Rhizobium sp. CSW-27]|uniref:LysR family transcriptional regulator n=1 Tax=Rhizobium sp. CSW-27 TaxID=2839985 RepID=UPI001C010B0E|nr:LysR substrate-binding domain-containing protein [Rhizobium sp. CSW-27]MBT9371039.1 LysR family transcriptional regulator [Rhizobium sp. CSW-27]